MQRPVPTQSWIDPAEQAWVVQHLAGFGLLKWSNAHDLPLKSGGDTDIYVSLRDARNDPGAIEFVTDLYCDPIQRLRVDRFAEVPDVVSCLGGPLSMATGTPYVTVREQAKPGRATDATIIGNLNAGDVTAVIDDVITDGASKVVPFSKLKARKAIIRALVVAVDRQQGWRKKFRENGIDIPVWSGMLLHDVRRELIAAGLMERCSAEVERLNPIIVALDGKSWDDILPVISRLRTTGAILKVNDLLFADGFDHLLRELSVYGRVMADIKGHDIENTLKNIAKRLLRWAPWAVTVHASGHEAMIKAVVETFKNAGASTLVLAVTVLTSFDNKTCREVYHELPWDQVKALAAIAHRAGAHGLVCSPKEVRRLRRLYPHMVLVTPGVRSPGADHGDQKRVDTPAASIASGANYVVGGRQFFDAPDPVTEIKRVMKDELRIAV